MTVECDAIAIRSQDGAYGCVTAVPDTSRPSAIAFSLLEESTLGLEMEQLIRPCLLTGSSALKYAKENGLFKDSSVGCGVISLQIRLKTASENEGSDIWI